MRRSVTAVVLAFVVAGCLGGVAPADQTATDAAGTERPVPDGKLSVHFIPVGQSVSTLIVAPSGETMLIDTGHFTDDGEYVLAYLDRLGIERIDHLVVSHNDADHIGGNAAIIEAFEADRDGIGAVYDPGIPASTETYEAYLDAVERHDVRLFEIREGDRLPFEGVGVDVLGPSEPYIANEDRNENSVVLRLRFGETAFLFTGDAEDDQEAYLRDRYGDRLAATVLKAGHHGSASSTSGALLDAVDPSAVVVSSAYDSQYGHPDEATLSRLSDRSIPTYWTATHGATVFVSDGVGVTVRTQRDAPTDAARLREADPIPLDEATRPTRRARYGPPADAVASPDGTAVTDGGVTDAASDVIAIADWVADPAGDDRANLNDERVVLVNEGDRAVNLTGWTLSDATDKTYTFPAGTTLAPGERVVVHTGSGTDTATDYYWGREAPVWNNDGDRITLRTAEGELVAEVTYE